MLSPALPPYAPLYRSRSTLTHLNHLQKGAKSCLSQARHAPCSSIPESALLVRTYPRVTVGVCTAANSSTARGTAAVDAKMQEQEQAQGAGSRAIEMEARRRTNECVKDALLLPSTTKAEEKPPPLPASPPFFFFAIESCLGLARVSTARDGMFRITIRV